MRLAGGITNGRIHDKGIVNDINGEVDRNRIIKAWPTDVAHSAPAKPATGTMQKITIGPVSNGDAMNFYNLAKELKLTDMRLYKAEYV